APANLQSAHAPLVVDDEVAAPLALRALREVALRVGDDLPRDVDAARPLDALEAGRAVDLEDLRAVLPLEHVDAGDLETHAARRGDGGGGEGLALVAAHAEAAGVEVRADLAGLRLAAHRRDDAPADDDRAVIAPLRLGDVLLQDDVLAHRPQRLEEARNRLRR